jgi:hypothetical protein
VSVICSSQTGRGENFSSGDENDDIVVVLLLVITVVLLVVVAAVAAVWAVVAMFDAVTIIANVNKTAIMSIRFVFNIRQLNSGLFMHNENDSLNTMPSNR